MLPENREYWIRGDDGLEYGPVGKEELREWIQENRIGLETVVRPDEPDSSWQHWQAHADLVALLAEVQSAEPGTIRPGLVAGNMVKRMLAFMLDFIFSIILSMPILVVLAIALRPEVFIQMNLASVDPIHHPPVLLSPLDEAWVLFIAYGMYTLYMAGFHALHGRTPGKSIMRLKVIDEHGNKPHFVTCLVRAMLFIVSLFLYCLPMAYAFFNPQRRAFHDYIAKTFVVEK